MENRGWGWGIGGRDVQGVCGGEWRTGMTGIEGVGGINGVGGTGVEVDVEGCGDGGMGGGMYPFRGGGGEGGENIGGEGGGVLFGCLFGLA